MSDNKNRSYTASDIQVFTNLQHIRKRTSMYVRSDGDSSISDAIIHTIWEVISNSVDELILQENGGNIYVAVLCDHNNNLLQVLVKDDGRGIPSTRLEDVCMSLGASGKIEGSAYSASAGMFGYGAKVMTALSSKYRIISHNYGEDVTASLHVEDAVKQGDVVFYPDTTSPSGVITVGQLDLVQFFHNDTEFMTSGYVDLCNKCREYNIFNEKINFHFYLYDRLLPERFWTADVPEALNIVDHTLTSVEHEELYDTDKTVDKAARLYELWRIRSSIVFRSEFEKAPVDENDRLSFKVKMFFTKKSATGNPQLYIAINNVVMSKSNNSAVTAFRRALTDHILPGLTEEHLIKFVKEEYRYPTLCLAIGTGWQGAVFSGTTKESYVDKDFEQQFYTELCQYFDEQGEEYWKRLTDVLKQDISSRYTQLYDTASSKSETRNVYLMLNNSASYKECRNTGGELYIVEGNSAGGIMSTRNADWQAIYTTRGKPYNAATDPSRITENRARLMKDPIYQDLMRITNISPNTTDMSTSRFSKIIIATDADDDGKHIAAIHLNNLYILNPRIIESGMVYLANPPLFSINASNNHRLFLRDEKAYRKALIECIYRPTFKFKIVMPDGNILLPDTKLENEMYCLFEQVGEAFYQVSQQLNIPITIIELFAKHVDMIYPEVNYDLLRDLFHDICAERPDVRVQYFPDEDYIVLSIGEEDYSIAMSVVGNTIIEHLLQYIVHYKITDFSLLVTSTNKGGSLHDTPVSVLTFVSAMRSLVARHIKVTRYKGLGKMPDSSCFATIMNPETRSLTHITSIGDWLANYRLVAKDDSTERKRLLSSATSELSVSFTKQNRY